MSNDRQYQRNKSNIQPNNKENYPNDIEDPYMNPKYDVPDQYGYSQWTNQGMVYGYDQYGYYPQHMNPYHGGLVSSFNGEIHQIPEPEAPKARQSGKKKIKLEYISGRNKRNVTFSKRKKGIMKKAYELNVLTGTEILLLVASESGHVYTFATPKLRPIINDHENIIQSCLNAQNPFESSLNTGVERCSDTDEYQKNEFSDDCSD
ncbi:Serum response factor like protein A [Nosema granulosis]|uniref:Serum response factor like protein A n=1 Tax=Nosema granulosis TaxID=83296 RepID=A0A9P6H272_9MICR|nr:Serum response factor like protein A [Nosema granulosis]